jgi:hypothetical protein
MKNRNLISLLFCLVIFLPSKCFYSPWCLQIYALAVSFFCACLGQMLIKLAARTSCHELTCSGEIMLFGPDSQVALSQLWNGLVANCHNPWWGQILTSSLVGSLVLVVTSKTSTIQSSSFLLFAKSIAASNHWHKN